MPETYPGQPVPARVRYEHTVLDLAESAGDDLAAIAALADACGSRRTTAARLAEVLSHDLGAPARLAGRGARRRSARDLLGARTRLPDLGGAAARSSGGSSPGISSCGRSFDVAGRPLRGLGIPRRARRAGGTHLDIAIAIVTWTEISTPPSRRNSRRRASATDRSSTTVVRRPRRSERCSTGSAGRALRDPARSVEQQIKQLELRLHTFRPYQP